MSNRIDVNFATKLDDLKRGTSQVKSSIKEIGKVAKEQRGAIASMGEGMKSFIAASVSIGGAVAGMRALVGVAKEYAAVGAKAMAAGLGPEFFQKLSAAATVTKGSIEQLQEAATKLNTAIEFSQPTALSTRALEAMGFSIETLQRMSPDERFEKIAKAIASITDPAQRSAAAVALFGEAGGKLIPTFVELNKHADETNVLTQEQIRHLDEAGNAWTRWALRAKAAMAQVVVEATDGTWLEKLAKIRPGMIAGSGGAMAADAMGGTTPDAKRDIYSYPPGHRGGDKPNFREMIERHKAEEAESARAEAEGKKIADLARKKSGIQRGMEFASADQSGQVAMLEAERAAIMAELAKTADPLRKAELETELAEKTAALAALKRKDSGRESSGGGGGGASAPAPATQPDLSTGQLREELDAAAFRSDPANYDPETGKMLTGALGQGRLLDRKAGRSRATENRRIARGFGGATSSRQGSTGRADELRRDNLPDMSRPDPKTEAMEQKRKEMQDMMKTSGGGAGAGPGASSGDPGKDLASILERVTSLDELVKERLPSGTA